MAKPKLHILIPDRKDQSYISHAESSYAYQNFDVTKGNKIKPGSDLVYTQNYPNGSVMLELQKWSGPYVCLMGGDVWNEIADHRRISTINLVLDKSALVLTVSKNLAEIAKQHLKTNVMALPGGMWGIDENPNGICAKKFFFKNSFKIENRKPKILMGINVGIARKYVGMGTFAKVVRKHFGDKVDLFCGGAITDPDMAYHFENDHGIKMLGKRMDWNQHMHKYDLFAHPSMFDCFPRTLAESMCAKLPSVAFDIAGTPEVSRLPIMVDPEEPEEIVKAVDALLSDQALREYQAERCYQEAQEKTENHRYDFANILLMTIGRK